MEVREKFFRDKKFSIKTVTLEKLKGSPEKLSLSFQCPGFRSFGRSSRTGICKTGSQLGIIIPPRQVNNVLGCRLILQVCTFGEVAAQENAKSNAKQY